MSSHFRPLHVEDFNRLFNFTNVALVRTSEVKKLQLLLYGLGACQQE